MSSDRAVVRYFDTCIRPSGVARLEWGVSKAIDLIAAIDYVPPALDGFDDATTERREVTICGLGAQRRPGRAR